MLFHFGDIWWYFIFSFAESRSLSFPWQIPYNAPSTWILLGFPSRSIVPSLLRVASAWDTWASKANCCAAAQPCRWCCTSCPSGAPQEIEKRGSTRWFSPTFFLGFFCGSDLLERLSGLELRDCNGQWPEQDMPRAFGERCGLCFFDVERFYQKWHEWKYALQDASIMFNPKMTETRITDFGLSDLSWKR